MKSTKKSLSVVAVLVFLFAVLAGCGGGGGGSSSPAPAKKVPSAPASIWVKSGVTEAEISFSTPTSDGGSPITSYTVVSSTGQTASGTESPITITGLPLVERYTFQVYANNANGAGDPSISSTVVPTATGSMPLMEKEGGSYFSVVQRPDGGYFCQCGDQKREVKIFSDSNNNRFSKLYLDSNYAFVFVSRGTVGTSVEDLLLVKINRTDFSFTTKQVLVNADCRSISRFEKESFFQILYTESNQQHMKEIDLNGNDIRTIPQWSGIYSFDAVAVTATRVYMLGDITRPGEKTKPCVKQFSRDYTDLGDSVFVNPDGDYTTYFSDFSIDTGRGILISVASSIPGTVSGKEKLLSMDFETGTFALVFDSNAGSIGRPFYDSQGNIYFTACPDGINTYLYKIIPDGKMWSRLFSERGRTSQIFFEGDDVIMLYDNPYSTDINSHYRPAPLKIYSISTGWTQVN